MDIYLYTGGPPLFPAPPGAAPLPKPCHATHAPRAPRPPSSAPRHGQVLLDMDKTEASVIRIQISRTDPANPHSFVARITYNWNCARFAVNLSAYHGLTLIYHKISHLSSALPLQLDDSRPGQRGQGRELSRYFTWHPKTTNNALTIYVLPTNWM